MSFAKFFFIIEKTRLRQFKFQKLDPPHVFSKEVESELDL
jgi:hypothetical protein